MVNVQLNNGATRTEMAQLSCSIGRPLSGTRRSARLVRLAVGVANLKL